VNGVTGVVDRIAQIQSRIDQISPQRASSSSFDVVLGTVLSQSALSGSGLTLAASTVGGTSGTGGVGTGASLVDADGIPVALKAYGNGRIPAQALSTIEGTSQQLWAPAARSLEALRSAAAADGVTVGITDSYRTYESQVDLVQRKGLYSQGGLAAAPGTSRHGWGVAVDLRLDATAQAWMRTNAAQFGFNENVAREPWHWEYEPLTA
jgi:hypothetical protein